MMKTLRQIADDADKQRAKAAREGDWARERHWRKIRDNVRRELAPRPTTSGE